MLAFLEGKHHIFTQSLKRHALWATLCTWWGTWCGWHYGYWLPYCAGFNSRNVPWEVVKLNCNSACQGCGSNDEDQIRSSLHASWPGTLSGAWYSWYRWLSKGNVHVHFLTASSLCTSMCSWLSWFLVILISSIRFKTLLCMFWNWI
jgi:hypothetical protein